jgi:crossover junction endodeoxyribonuclease RuvC
MGIDPGSRVTGYGLIKTDGYRHQYMASGCIKTQTDNLADRLKQIFAGIHRIAQEHQPDTVAVEQVFLAKNANSALKLGQARGAAIAAIGALDRKLVEYSTRAIKKAVVGYGAAEKQQIQHMIKLLLNLSSVPQVDAADALAVAICHAQSAYITELV